MTEPKPNSDELNQQISTLEETNRQLQSQNQDLALHLEIANERWVEAINKNASLEVQLRKLNNKD